MNPGSSIKNIKHLIEKMIESLEKHDDKQIVRSQNALDGLFGHHVEKEKEAHPESGSSSVDAIEAARKQINDYIDSIFEGLFDRQLSMF